MTHSISQSETIHLGHVDFYQGQLNIEQVVAIAKGAPVKLNDSPKYQDYIEKGARFIDSLLHEEGVVYGVTTGYGDSCTVNVLRIGP
jgi:histidine ammonia-lyase